MLVLTFDDASELVNLLRATVSFTVKWWLSGHKSSYVSNLAKSAIKDVSIHHMGKASVLTNAQGRMRCKRMFNNMFEHLKSKASSARVIDNWLDRFVV